MSPLKDKDPYFGLKYIAYCRTGIPINPDDIDGESFLTFVKWQICKVRNVLWNDPIWDRYTKEEMLIEFFALRFDENVDSRNEFEAGLVTAKATDIEWMERMERKFAAEAAAKQGKIKEEEVPEKTGEVPKEPSEYEDTFK